jgi:SAM-dependent methyltransferase
MPTIAPEPSPSLRPERLESHQYRQVAESFGANAERYDRARPSYPDALVQRILAARPGADVAADVLDVGCGTGISSRLFRAAGCKVLGIDPDTRMADLARQSGLEVEIARIEEWDPAGRTFDAVVAGQAWHWVDPLAGAAKAAQALRPGGRLAVFWNAFEPPADLNQAFAAVFARLVPGSPLARTGMPGGDGYAALCAKAADGMRQTGAFGEPEHWRFGWDRPYTRDEWLEFVPTAGGFSSHPQDTQRELLAGIGAAIDAAGGSFVMHYVTVVGTAARTGTG